MKRYFLFFIITALVCVGIAAGAMASAAYGKGVLYNGTAPETGVTLYEERATTTTILGQYSNGLEVQVLSDPAYEWVRIRIGLTEGYIPSANLVYDAALIAELPQMPMTVKVVSNDDPSSWLNLRDRPSRDGNVLGRYYNGVEVVIYGEMGDWSYVLVEGNTGYMMTRYLQAEGTRVLAPAETPKAELLPVEGIAREYTVNKYVEFSGYTVSASLVESSRNQFLVNVSIQYPEVWTMTDTINSFSLYVNGQKKANIPVVAYEGSMPRAFSTTVTITEPITALRLLPNWSNAPEYERETVNFSF